MHRARRLRIRLLTRRQVKILSLLVALVYLALRAASDGKMHDALREVFGAASSHWAGEASSDVASGPATDAESSATSTGASVALGVAGDPRSSASVRLLPLSPLDSNSALPSEHCDTKSCQSLLDLIEHAERRIDFSIYGIRKQPQIFAALVAAKQRGVAIRGVVDRDQDGKFEYADTDDLIEALQSVRSDEIASEKVSPKQKMESNTAKSAKKKKFNTKFNQFEDKLSSMQEAETTLYDAAIMHNKFFVVDGRWVWTSSANLSDIDITGYSANLTVLIDSPEIAACYAQEVEQMYEQGRFHRNKRTQDPCIVSVGSHDDAKQSDSVRVQVFFPPKGDALKELSSRIRAAKQNIDIAVFYLTHKDLARDLIEAHRRGVKVRVILDATAAQNPYSVHTRIRDAGISLKVENWGGKMHAKSAVIDGRFVVAGSANWTKAAFAKNDENLLVLDSSAQATIYQEWFDALWASIPERYLAEDPDPESWDSGSACSDGIDNDFDGSTDARDFGCAQKSPAPTEKTLESPTPQAVQ